MAICASKAGGQTANSLINDCTGNRVVAQITVSRTDTSGNFVTADIITLDAFGEGARFRSDYLNGTSGARRYAASATFFAHADEAVTGADTTCRDEVAVAWRSRWAPPLAGATGERGASE
jgi:hypothetical protein